MRFFGKIFALGAASAALTSVGSVTPITNNGFAAAASLVRVPSGTLLASASGVLNSGTFLATYTESVYEASNNVFGSGDLTFVMHLTKSANPPGVSNDSIERIATGLPKDGFANFSIDAGYEDGTGPSILCRYLR